MSTVCACSDYTADRPEHPPPSFPTPRPTLLRAYAMQHLRSSDDSLLLKQLCNDSSDSSGIMAVQILREKQAAAALRIQVCLTSCDHMKCNTCDVLTNDC